jgi:two-component system, NarL family, response regulator EvgA
MMTEQTSVVIVESQPIMRTALSTTLSNDGMTVLAEVADSRDALQTASSLTPDLILFSVNDINLKDLDRISALRVEIPSSRIVALITGEFRGQFQSAKDHGAHLVLTKSTPRSELLSAIKSMLKKVIYPAIAQVN